MTWANPIFVYAAIGLAVSIVTLRTFPPMEGFVPKLSVRMLAGLVFATLWPFLVVLATWYLCLGSFCRSRQGQVELQSSHSNIDLGAMQQQMVSKPR